MTKKPFKTWLIASDIHLPKENKAALDCWFQTMALIKPDGVLLNGDILDCGVWSRHDIFQPPKCYWTDSQFLNYSKKDYAVANKFFDLVARLSPQSKKVYLGGNHEEWLNEFIARSYESRYPSFSIEKRIQHISSWERKGYRKVFYLGKLRVVHTLFDSRSGAGGGGGKYHASKHVEIMGASTLYGHYHDIQCASKVTPERDSHMAWCTGCLCDLNPDYLRNGAQNWSHGFAIVYLFANGNFQVDQKRIVNGKVIVNGELLDGNARRFWK